MISIPSVELTSLTTSQSLTTISILSSFGNVGNGSLISLIFSETVIIFSATISKSSKTLSCISLSNSSFTISLIPSSSLSLK